MKQLSLIEKAFFLKKVSIFNDLDLDLLIAIADKMNFDLYDKNEKIFDINQIATRMYFIIEGIVNLYDTNNILIKQLFKGDFFGDEALFNEKPRAYIAVCDKNAALLTLSKTNLMNIISECPNTAISLLQNYAHNTNIRMR